MIRLDMAEGFTLWVNPAHIVCFFDDPEREIDDNHVAVVKLCPGSIQPEGTLLAVTQSATELKAMIHLAQFEEISDA